MKSRATTLIERHGFLDEDRKCQNHDLIQMWSYENAETILRSFTSEGKKIQVDKAILERPIIYETRNFQSIVGYIDLLVYARVIAGDEKKEIRAAIEVKSRISSIGDLIRQIQFYRGYQTIEYHWIVISPDDRFSHVLRAQNILFYKYVVPNVFPKSLFEQDVN